MGPLVNQAVSGWKLSQVDIRVPLALRCVRRAQALRDRPNYESYVFHAFLGIAAGLLFLNRLQTTGTTGRVEDIALNPGQIRFSPRI